MERTKHDLYRSYKYNLNYMFLLSFTVSKSKRNTSTKRATNKKARRRSQNDEYVFFMFHAFDSHHSNAADVNSGGGGGQYAVLHAREHAECAAIIEDGASVGRY